MKNKRKAENPGASLLWYILIGYTAVFLLLVSICFLYDGGKQTKRDMVYYNEQKILIEEALSNGRSREETEEKYDCRVIFRTDPDYELTLQEALQKEALVVDYFRDKEPVGKIIWNENERHFQIMEKKLRGRMLAIAGLICLSGYLLIGFIYLRIIRPFQYLQKFSRQVAKGNLDFPLTVKRHDYFGAFTESFDLMREELKLAKEREYEANRSKRELMAELSHDIKTPVASIRAACEVLQLKEKNPDTLEKIAVIDSKAHTIQKLVDNLFSAALEELEVLKVEPVEESSLCLLDMLSEQELYGKLDIIGEAPGCLVYMDRLRLQQVIDNCLNNAWKYANTPVEVSFAELEEGIAVKLRDFGSGVAEEELPLVAGKFYRGANAKGMEGSGLGLYLAKTFMERMKGDLQYYNEEGFVVELFLRKV